MKTSIDVRNPGTLLLYISHRQKYSKEYADKSSFLPISYLTSRTWFCGINLLFKLISKLNIMAHPQLLICKDLLFEIPAVLFRFDRVQQTHGMRLFLGGCLQHLCRQSLSIKVFLESRHKRGNKSDRRLCSDMQSMFSGDSSSSGPHLQAKISLRSGKCQTAGTLRTEGPEC